MEPSYSETLLPSQRFQPGGEYSGPTPVSTTRPMHMSRIDILGTEGSLFINDLDQTLHLCERGKGWSFPGMLRWPGVREGDPGVESYALKDELEHFARSARGLAEPVITGEEALKTLRVIDAAHQSLMTGRPADVGTATTR